MSPGGTGGLRPTRAAALTASAAAQYDLLLTSHRHAFVDHGSEFFMGPGADPQRAYEMAVENYGNRPTERALTLVINAAAGAGKPLADWCAAAPKELKTAPLREALELRCP